MDEKPETISIVLQRKTSTYKPRPLPVFQAYIIVRGHIPKGQGASGGGGGGYSPWLSCRCSDADHLAVTRQARITRWGCYIKPEHRSEGIYYLSCVMKLIVQDPWDYCPSYYYCPPFSSFNHFLPQGHISAFAIIIAVAILVTLDNLFFCGQGFIRRLWLVDVLQRNYNHVICVFISRILSYTPKQADVC